MKKKATCQESEVCLGRASASESGAGCAELLFPQFHYAVFRKAGDSIPNPSGTAGNIVTSPSISFALFSARLSQGSRDMVASSSGPLAKNR